MKKKTLLTAVFVSVFDPFHYAWLCEGDVSLNRSTEPPTFLPLSPENDTVHAVDTISLSSSLNGGTSSTASSMVLDEIYCETDWQQSGGFRDYLLNNKA